MPGHSYLYWYSCSPIWCRIPYWQAIFIRCLSPSAFVISSVVAIAISKGGKLSNRIEQFCRGAANSNIMLMVLIFILAGAFAQTAKAMGAVDATVNLAMSILPGNLLAAGIFLAACLYVYFCRDLRRYNCCPCHQWQ